MFARVISVLAILAIAVVTTISAAHAARMGGMQADHAIHPAGMMQASAGDHPSCNGGQDCGSADAAICAFACAGLPAFLTMPGVEAGQASGPASLHLPSEASHVGHAPGLHERPPRPRLI